MGTLPDKVVKAIQEKLKKKSAGSVFSEKYLKQFADSAYKTEDYIGEAHKTEDYIGEARGYYPKYRDSDLQKAFFQPWNSFFHKERHTDGVHRRHGGVDIYASYFPFPHEIPVCAITDGVLEARTYWGDYSYDKDLKKWQNEALGNRLRIRTSVKIDNKWHHIYFDYGHLNRFAGNDRNSEGIRKKRLVSAGEVIGYIGKSGNADDQKEASTRGATFKVNSGHVHLTTWYAYGKDVFFKFDPLKILPKKLAFHPDNKELGYATITDEKEARPKFEDWKKDSQPKFKSEQPTVKVDSYDLQVKFFKAPERRGKSQKTSVGKRFIYARPFDVLEVDYTAALKGTSFGLKLMQKRLVKAKVTIKTLKSKEKTKPAAVADAIEHWRVLCDPNEAHHDDKFWGETVGAYLNRAENRLEKISPGEKHKGAHAVIAFLHVLEALYILMGGPALQVLGQDWGRKVKKGSIAEKFGQQVYCGHGVKGAIRAVHYNRAVGAVHHSNLPMKIGDQNFEKQTISVTFGAGSLRHATLSEIFYTKNGDKPEKYLLEVWKNCVEAFWLHISIGQYHNRLSDGDSNALTSTKKDLSNLVKDLSKTAEELLKLSDKDILALMDLLVQTNQKVFKAAIDISKAVENPMDPAAPKIYTLETVKIS